MFLYFSDEFNLEERKMKTQNKKSSLEIEQKKRKVMRKTARTFEKLVLKFSIRSGKKQRFVILTKSYAPRKSKKDIQKMGCVLLHFWG